MNIISIEDDDDKHCAPLAPTLAGSLAPSAGQPHSLIATAGRLPLVEQMPSTGAAPCVEHLALDGQCAPQQRAILLVVPLVGQFAY